MSENTLLPIAIVTPGWSQLLWVCVLAFMPLLIALAYGRIAPNSTRALSSPVRIGIPLALGIIGAMSATIGCWVIGDNGAWRSDDGFQLRASRAFFVELPIAELRPGEAAPLDFETLQPEGRIRTPGYAAGAYRDAAGRQVLVLWAGAPLTRIPTEGDFDLAFAIADPAVLR